MRGDKQAAPAGEPVCNGPFGDEEACPIHGEEIRRGRGRVAAPAGEREPSGLIFYDKSLVAGKYEGTFAQFTRRAGVLIAEEQAKPLPDNALIAFLCDSIRMAREAVASMANAQVGEREPSGEWSDGYDAGVEAERQRHTDPMVWLEEAFSTYKVMLKALYEHRAQSVQPAPGADEGLREDALVKKWRACAEMLETGAEHVYSSSGAIARENARVHKACADELEAALRSASPVAPHAGSIQQVGSPANVRATWIRLALEIINDDGEMDQGAVDALIAYGARQAGASPAGEKGTK